MKVLIESYFDHPSARVLDSFACEYLSTKSIAAENATSVRDDVGNLSSYSVLVSRGELPEHIRSRVRSYGGKNLSRIQGLDYLRRADIGLMYGSTAGTLGDVERLFDVWQTDRLILKRSGSVKGRGISLLSGRDLAGLEWDPARDVFCAEVNSVDGTVGKLECFAGRLIFAWLWKFPPIREMCSDGVVNEEVLLASARIPDANFPDDVVSKAIHCSELATADGLGYTSLDLMRSPSRAPPAPALQTPVVATWWTYQFPSVRQNYADALYRLVRNLPDYGTR